MSDPIPTPGSPDAISRGCKCPGMSNGHGRGVHVNERGETLWWYSGDCPLHVTKGEPAPKDPETMELGLFGEGK